MPNNNMAPRGPNNLNPNQPGNAPYNGNWANNTPNNKPNKKRNKALVPRKPTVLPLYITAAVWLAVCLSGGLYRVGGFVALFADRKSVV
jgi:hypothetical protein